MPRTGGGINSRVVSNVNAPKQEPRPHAVSVGAVSRQGAAVGVGTPFKPLISGAGYSTPQGPTPMTPDMCKPGGGRQIMRAGSQSPTPAARPMPAATRKF
jgi:hypothetical protein